MDINAPVFLTVCLDPQVRSNDIRIVLNIQLSYTYNTGLNGSLAPSGVK